MPHQPVAGAEQRRKDTGLQRPDERPDGRRIPQASMNQNTFACPLRCTRNSSGMRVTAQMVSLRNAWPPRPRAKNANR